MCVPPIGGGRASRDLSDAMKTKVESEDKIQNECPSCSQELENGMEKCPNCGMEFEDLKEKEKDSKIAAFTSLLFPGLGQFYNEQIGKGIFFLIVGVLCAVYIYYYVTGAFIFPPMVFIALFWLYNVYDAFSTAK